MHEMIFPPITIGDVKVRELQLDTRTIAVEIELDVETHSDLNLTSARVQAAEKLKGALAYLHKEDFVKEPIVSPPWNIVVFAGMKTKNS